MSDTQDFRDRFGPQSSFCAAAAYRAIEELEAALATGTVDERYTVPTQRHHPSESLVVVSPDELMQALKARAEGTTTRQDSEEFDPALVAVDKRMIDFGSGLEQYGPQHQRSGKATKADLRRHIYAETTRANKAEAALADRDRMLAHSGACYRDMEAAKLALSIERDELKAAMAERDELQREWYRWGLRLGGFNNYNSDQMERDVDWAMECWYADLRARAEEANGCTVSEDMCGRMDCDGCTDRAEEGSDDE